MQIVNRTGVVYFIFMLLHSIQPTHSAKSSKTHQHDGGDEYHPHDRYQRPPSPFLSVLVVAGFGVLPVEAENDDASHDERQIHLVIVDRW